MREKSRMYYVNEGIRDLYRVKFHEERGQVLRLDMNENPEGLPEDVFERVMRKITRGCIAMYPEKDRLTGLLAKHNGVRSEEISVTAGSDEAMRLIFQCFGQRGKKLVTVTPTFEMYGVYAGMFGLEHRMVEYKEDYTVDVEDILEAIDGETGMVILLNPNSPVGYAYGEAEVRKVIERAKEAGAVVVVDEAYHYFYAPTFMGLIREYENVLVLRTFSKVFSMAGLRIGYVAGCEELIGYIEKAESTFNVNTVAIRFAEEVIGDTELLERLTEREREGRIWLSGKLKEAGYRTISMEGNYVLFIPKGESGEVVKALKEEGVWVRDYGRGILKGWIRVSTGAVECMERFWEALVRVEDGSKNKD